FTDANRTRLNRLNDSARNLLTDSPSVGKPEPTRRCSEVSRQKCSAGHQQLRNGLRRKPMILARKNLRLAACAAPGEDPLEFVGLRDRHYGVLCSVQHEG